MANLPQETIPDLIVRDVPRELILGIEDALHAGAARAFKRSKGIAEGHFANAVGTAKHFDMNEAFHRTLAAAGASPSPLRGNDVVTGRSGIFTLTRLNAPYESLMRGKQSKIRCELARLNKELEPLRQGKLFDAYQAPSRGLVLFIANFTRTVKDCPGRLVTIRVGVPDSDMENLLFIEPLSLFLKRYDSAEAQPDLAKPKLKQNIHKRDKDGSAE